MDVRPRRALVALFKWEQTWARLTSDMVTARNWPDEGLWCEGVEVAGSCGLEPGGNGQ